MHTRACAALFHVWNGVRRARRREVDGEQNELPAQLEQLDLPQAAHALQALRLGAARPAPPAHFHHIAWHHCMHARELAEPQSSPTGCLLFDRLLVVRPVCVRPAVVLGSVSPMPFAYYASQSYRVLYSLLATYAYTCDLLNQLALTLSTRLLHE